MGLQVIRISNNFVNFLNTVTGDANVARLHQLRHDLALDDTVVALGLETVEELHLQFSELSQTTFVADCLYYNLLHLRI